MKLNNGPLVHRFWNRKSHCDAFHKPTLFPPNKRSNLIFDVTFYIKINYSTYWRPPPNPPPPPPTPVPHHSAFYSPSVRKYNKLFSLYVITEKQNLKNQSNFECLNLELGDLNKINSMNFTRNFSDLQNNLQVILLCHHTLHCSFLVSGCSHYYILKTEKVNVFLKSVKVRQFSVTVSQCFLQPKRNLKNQSNFECLLVRRIEDKTCETM